MIDELFKAYAPVHDRRREEREGSDFAQLASKPSQHRGPPQKGGLPLAYLYIPINRGFHHFEKPRDQGLWCIWELVLLCLLFTWMFLH